jgi:chitinase
LFIYLFRSGSTENRPFDTSVVDGYDLDIEGGTPEYWSSFVNRIRELEPEAILSAAPQCVYPDGIFYIYIFFYFKDYI